MTWLIGLHRWHHLILSASQTSRLKPVLYRLVWPIVCSNAAISTFPMTLEGINRGILIGGRFSARGVASSTSASRDCRVTRPPPDGRAASFINNWVKISVWKILTCWKQFFWKLKPWLWCVRELECKVGELITWKVFGVCVLLLCSDFSS